MKPTMEASPTLPAELGTRALEDRTGGEATALVPAEGRWIKQYQEGVLVLSERELSRRVGRYVRWWSLVSIALGVAAALFVSAAVRDRVRGPERLGDLHFPAFGELVKGTTTYLNPGDINATEKNAAWRILDAQTWARIGCRNAAVQGSGPGHDITLTAMRGRSPLSLSPTSFTCRIVGTGESYATCDSSATLALREGEWVTLAATSGPNVENGAQVYCEVQRYKGNALTSELVRRGAR